MDVEALIRQADKALGSGDLAVASQLLERATAERPDDPSLWLRLAALHRGAGKPQLALNAVRRALEHAPRD
ncbi:MAG: tetratricopeptide repeat protein, partial [Sphingomicrobium sp.]